MSREAIPASVATPVLPLFASPVHAGFPSPADDFIEQQLNLHDLLVTRPAATYFLRVVGDSMRDAGIVPGDVLVVDRSLPALHGDIVIASLDGEFTVKRLEKNGGRVRLLAENEHYAPIVMHPENELQIWGVVTYVIHKPCLRRG